MLVVSAAAFVISMPMPVLADSPASSQTADPNQRMKCKSEIVTGTLAQRRRVCHTVAEWDRIAQNAQQTARDIVDKGLINCGECR